MKFMLLIYCEEVDIKDPAREQCYAESAQMTHELHAKGQYLASAPLYPSRTAASITVRAGKQIVTDGPFAETREQFGGYFLVDVPSMEEAIEVAKRVPAGKYGTIEVRQVIEVPNLPQVGIAESKSLLTTAG